MLNGKRSSFNLDDGKLNNGASGKMIRKGEYTIYNGKEYRFIESDTVEAIELISNDKKDIESGFIYYKNNIYTKMKLKNYILLIPMLDIRERCFQHLKKEKPEKYCWIQQTLNLPKRWGLNEQINICTPNLWNGMKWR
jgi:hypothetical protein